MHGGTIVREARRRAGITQAELADRVATTQSALARLERGHSEPSFMRVRELVRASGFDLRIGLTPIDDSNWSVAYTILQLDTDQRVRQLLAVLELGRDGRAARGSPMVEPELSPARILGTLTEFGIRSILVGGLAGTIHGSPYSTWDVDIVPERTSHNLDRLSDALRALHARTWTGDQPGGVAFDPDARSLADEDVVRLVTDHGRLDIVFIPTGTQGYDDLARDAIHLKLLGVDTVVASLADVIRSKEACDRDQDRLVLPVLRRILDETSP